MRPFHHARASAAARNRDWREDLDIHEFLDSSKTAFADLRHRMILHSVDFGVELVARAFPERADAREISSRHIVEDLGEPRTLAGWLDLTLTSHLPVPRIPLSDLDVDLHLEGERARQNLGDVTGPRMVWDLLTLPLAFAPEHGDRALCVMANTFGISLIRRISGPPYEVPGVHGRAVPFDAAWCAEGLIYRLYKTIPDLRSVVTAITD